MRGFRQKFRKIRMPAKLVLPCFLIVAAAVAGIGGVLYASAKRQLAVGTEKVIRSAAQMAEASLRERCVRLMASLEYLATDNNVIQTVNRTGYISEYQKAYDVKNLLDTVLVNVSEQNELIGQVLFFTYGDIRGTREYFLDAEGWADSPWLTQSEFPVWRQEREQLGVSRILVNLWEPDRSGTVTVLVNREKLFKRLLPETGMDCRLRVWDDEGTLLYEEQQISDEKGWEAGAERRICAEGTVAENGWRFLVEGNPVPFSPLSLSLIRNLFLILLPAAAFLSLIFWLFYRGEIVKRDAQMKALQAQINPHFLYNTLSHLNWRAIEQGNMETSRLLTDLSKFYRLSLNGGRIESALRTELEHVCIYIRLYMAIHSDASLQVRWETDERVLDFKMPGMILQPLVENAFEHGLPKGGLAAFRLGICAGREGEYIVLKVSDNGEGMPEEKKKQIAEDEKGGEAPIGFGLRNVYRRLELYFGKDCGMSFEETPGGGTTVQIRFLPGRIQKERKGRWS